MKFLLISILMVLSFVKLQAQDLNWWQLRDQQQSHFIAAKFSADYATVAGLSYGQRLPGKVSTFLVADFSSPFGKDLLDDWKMRLSIQHELWHTGHLSLGIKPGFIVRRFDSNIARLFNTGVDLTATLGYYGAKWSLAADMQYDQTLMTNVQHHSLQEFYPGIYNGWIGATGGNFKFGGQVAYSFGGNMVSLKLGKAFARNFQDNSTLPFYFDVGFVKMW
jgi:hypothetical protein